MDWQLFCETAWGTWEGQVHFRAPWEGDTWTGGAHTAIGRAGFETQFSLLQTVAQIPQAGLPRLWSENTIISEMLTGTFYPLPNICTHSNFSETAMTITLVVYI